MAATGRVRVYIDADSSGMRREIGTAERSLRGLGGVGVRSLRGLATAAKYAGVAIAGGLVIETKRAVDEYREAEKAAAQTNAVIKSTGGVANVTAKQVAQLANAISLKAGIDDEAIQSGANLLLTFKNIRNEAGAGNKVFDEANRVITDMSVALDQDLKSSAIQVGKALNDPTIGLTALQRVGVTFTAQQKEQILAMHESGRTMQAQKRILKELNSEFAGSAAAQADPFDKAKVAVENLEEAFGGLIGPTFAKVATALAKFVTQIQNGTGAGGRFADILRGLVGNVKSFGSAIVNWIKTAIGDVKAFWKEADVLRAALDFMWQTAKRAWQGIKQIFQGGVRIVQGAVKLIGGILRGDFGDIWEGVKKIFSGALKALGGLIRGVTAPFREAAARVGEALGNAFSAAWEKIKSIFTEAVNWIINNVLNRIPAVDLPVVGGNQAAASGVGESVGKGAQNRFSGGLVTAPVAIVGEEAPCIAGGTLIETEDGERPIESVTVGTRVLTRNGYRAVVWSGKTRRNAEVVKVTTDAGNSVVCTPDHRIWTQRGNQSGNGMGSGPLRGRGLLSVDVIATGETEGGVPVLADDRSRHCGAVRADSRCGDGAWPIAPAGQPKADLRSGYRLAKGRPADHRGIPTVARRETAVESPRGAGSHRETGSRGGAATAVLPAWASALAGEHICESEGLLDLPDLQAREGARVHAEEACSEPRVCGTGSCVLPQLRGPKACWREAQDLAVGDWVWTLGADGEFRASRVAKVCAEADRIDTYDLMVEIDHEFIAAGILVHNSHPEVVIATNPRYRERNLGLWRQAGRMLGIPGFAEGGVMLPMTGGFGLTAGSLVSKLRDAPFGGLPDWLSGTAGWIKDKFAKFIRAKLPSAVSSVAGAVSGLKKTSASTLGIQALLAQMFGLTPSSGYRSPAHNAAVGGVPGSLHTHGTPSNPGAIDLVGPLSAMRAASAYAARKWSPIENMIHDAGSGLHLHLGFFRKGGIRTPSGMATILRRRGLDPRAARILGAVGFAESSGRLGAVGDGGLSHGPWQVYQPAWPQFSPSRLMSDWRYAADAAIHIYRTQGLGAWTMYTNGTYRSFLDQADPGRPAGGRGGRGGSAAEEPLGASVGGSASGGGVYAAFMPRFQRRFGSSEGGAQIAHARRYRRRARRFLRSGRASRSVEAQLEAQLEVLSQFIRNQERFLRFSDREARLIPKVIAAAASGQMGQTIQLESNTPVAGSLASY